MELRIIRLILVSDKQKSRSYVFWNMESERGASFPKRISVQFNLKEKRTGKFGISDKKIYIERNKLGRGTIVET